MMLCDTLKENGYRHCREVPNQGMCGVMRFLFTSGLCVRLDECGYSRRYCYADDSAAVAALESWNGEGDPSGPWIKEKPSDRTGPGAEARPLSGVERR